MIIIFLILLILMIPLIIGSFIVPEKKTRLICSAGYNAVFIGALIILLKIIPNMSLDWVRMINHNAGIAMVAGALLIVISALIERFLKIKHNEKRSAAYFLAFLGVLIIIGSNVVTMYTYVEISNRDKPVVTINEDVTIYTNTEYSVSDFICVENSHGEEFFQIAWSKNAYNDTSAIEISDDRKSFVVTENSGDILLIRILVHESKYSDSECVTVKVKVEDH